MRVERHKKEITFFGWVLVSSLLLIAAARAEDAVYSGGSSLGPLPANNSSPQEILRRARGTLPADQYDAFEKAMKRIESGNTGPAQPAGAPTPNRAGVPGEPVIDGAGIPSVITFGPPAPTQQQPDRAPAEVGPQPQGTPPKVVNPGPPAPAPAPTSQAQPKPPSKPGQLPRSYDPSFPAPDPVK